MTVVTGAGKVVKPDMPSFLVVMESGPARGDSLSPTEHEAQSDRGPSRSARRCHTSWYMNIRSSIIHNSQRAETAPNPSSGDG